MCRLRIRPRTDVDPPRVELRGTYRLAVSRGDTSLTTVCTDAVGSAERAAMSRDRRRQPTEVRANEQLPVIMGS